LFGLLYVNQDYRWNIVDDSEDAEKRLEMRHDQFLNMLWQVRSWHTG
jgi:hypothetical protein